MSRVGKKPIVIPQGIECSIDNGKVKVKGQKGQLTTLITSNVEVEIQENQIVVKPKSSSKASRTDWGTCRSNINSIITGIATGFEKTLVLEGVGYRAAVQGNDLVMQLGYSHEIKFPIPASLEITVEKNTVIHIKGIDKELLGLTAAKIRSLRKPEPYKLKGVKYKGEYIMQKEGKKK